MRAIDKSDVLEALMSVAKEFEEDNALMEAINIIGNMEDVECVPVENGKIEKDPYAKLNTYFIPVVGLIGDGISYKRKLLYVRFTSDTHETISITDGEADIQYIMAFDGINEMIRKARNEWKKKRS